ncbi:unnamed protein product [Rotaria socialis]|uniref:Exostosin GT47 domain-containing protein n=2 Tax=Rotaria socialis TaxID=392032 RepID=A0A821SAT0_9BILA|nr:unnamed protein product [Rotaria socialis]
MCLEMNDNAKHYPVRLRSICIICIGIPTIVFIYQNIVHHRVSIQISKYYFPLCNYLSIITNNRIVFNNASYFIHHYPEFICPQNFRNLADWVYGWPEDLFNEHMDSTMNSSYVTVPNLPHGSIIYIKPDVISSFFQRIYPYLQNEFVLITGQSDISVPNKYLRYLERSDSKVIHWFGQNGDISASESKRFTHIPIGLNCFEMAETIRSVHQQYSNYTLPSLFNQSIKDYYVQPFDITQKVLNTKNNVSDKLLLLNFHPNTDSTGLRIEVWNHFCQLENYSFATCFGKSLEGVDDKTTLRSIYERNRQYPLWLSPRGNGIDCHRTWEALYLDAVPIVWHSTIDSLYADLPIIIINDLNDINEQFLRNKLHEIAVKKIRQPPVYRYEKLRNSFWRDMILKKSRHSSTNTHLRKNRCWRGKTIE